MVPPAPAWSSAMSCCRGQATADALGDAAVFTALDVTDPAQKDAAIALASAVRRARYLGQQRRAVSRPRFRGSDARGMAKTRGGQLDRGLAWHQTGGAGPQGARRRRCQGQRHRQPASVAGVVGSELDPLYSMTKGGVTLFTKSTASILGARAIASASTPFTPASSAPIWAPKPLSPAPPSTAATISPSEGRPRRPSDRPFGRGRGHRQGIVFQLRRRRFHDRLGDGRRRRHDRALSAEVGASAKDGRWPPAGRIWRGRRPIGSGRGPAPRSRSASPRRSAAGSRSSPAAGRVRGR